MDTPILANDLRAAVLQAAISGKLTKQLDTDSSIDDLLTKIMFEKEQVIKDKKIKKEKILPLITEEELKFEIPKEWKWVRMQSVLDVRDGTHDSPKYFPTGIPFVTSKNLINGEISFENVKYISKEDADLFNQRSKVDKNDILMAMIGSIGKPVLVKVEKEFAIKNMALIKAIPNTNVNMKYILIILKYMESTMNKESSGGVQKFVSLNYLREFPIPLPPIEEQQRIVERVEKLMAKIDEYEEIEKQLVKLKKGIPGDMRVAILQAALEGRLTTQLLSDSLVDFSLIKTKKYSQLGELYDLPDNWINVHLEDVTKTISTKKYQILDSQVKAEGKYPVVSQSKEFSIGFCDLEEKVLYPNKELIIFGDHTTIVKKINAPFIVGADGVKIFEANDNILPTYLYYVLVFNASKVSQMGGYSRHFKYLKNISIPLPPIEEQQRIVEILDKLLPLCDELI